jgi:7-cyano-7-deazaguanine synthase in queuosine biosynthesis
VAVTTFRLRTNADQTAPPPPTVLLDWFSNGHGSTIQSGGGLTAGLIVPSPARDLFTVAAAVYCADRVVPRPAEWTRNLVIEFPVTDGTRWHEVNGRLTAALSFLSGDAWQFMPLATNTQRGALDGVSSPADPVDAVCLFSGGLDSFAGAVDLLAEGQRVCLVGHYEGGQAPKTQEHLSRRLAQRYGEDRVVLRRLVLRPAPPSGDQQRPLPDSRESSTRSRSLLFLAAGLAVAAGYGPKVPLYIPENGFIGINVPLTAARFGSFSTRTTHPYFMATLASCLAGLGITNKVVNPFRLMTKGELVASSRDSETMRALARVTLSCAHPEASRYAEREQGNCGYCFPCLIRRGSLYHVGLDEPGDYAFDVLREHEELMNERGSDFRALVRSLSYTPQAVDVLRNGPVPDGELHDFAAVYRRGRLEILDWIKAQAQSDFIRRQLP